MHISIYLCLGIHLSIHLSRYPSIELSIYWFSCTCMSVCLSLCLSVYLLLVFLSLCISVFLSFCLSVCLSASLSVYAFVCMYFYCESMHVRLNGVQVDHTANYTCKYSLNNTQLYKVDLSLRSQLWNVCWTGNHVITCPTKHFVPAQSWIGKLKFA